MGGGVGEDGGEGKGGARGHAPSGFSLRLFGGFTLTHLRLTDVENVGPRSLRGLASPLG